MAISVNWVTGVITVPRADMLLIQSVPTEIRQLDVMAFKVELADLKDNVEGRWASFPFTHNTDEEVEGIFLANVFKILPPYTVTFEDGLYGVNLEGANNNIKTRTNRNQVSISPSNSAGLINLKALMSGAYGGQVAYRALNGYAGTITPIGTLGYPSNNWADAMTIMDNSNAKEILLMGQLTLVAGDNANYRTVVGVNPLTSIVTVDNASDTIGMIVKNITFSGDLDGGAVLEHSILGSINYFSGYINDCALGNATITLNGVAVFRACSAGAHAFFPPILDLLNAASLAMWDYQGVCKLINCTNPAVRIDITGSGTLIIDSSCTEGTFYISGDIEVVHTQTGNEVIYDKTTGSPADIWNHSDRTLTEAPGLTEAQNTVLMMTKYQNKAVYVDTEALVNGDGSATSPYDNVKDGADFAEANGIKIVYLYGDVIIDRSVKNFTVIGIGNPLVNCNDKNLQNMQFIGCRLTGSYTDSIKAEKCFLMDGFEVNGRFKDCVIQNNLIGGNNSYTIMYDCFSDNTAHVSLNASGTSVFKIIGFQSPLVISDVNANNDEIEIHMDKNKLTLESTCTDGKIKISGLYDLEDNSTGSAITETFSPATIANETWAKVLP